MKASPARKPRLRLHAANFNGTVMWSVVGKRAGVTIRTPWLADCARTMAWAAYSWRHGQ